MAHEDWRERKYDEVFRWTRAHLQQRRQLDASFTREYLQQLLETEYVNEGNDWTGRGVLGNIVQSATIAAYEAFLQDWKEQDRTDDRPSDSA
jgi:hypothetical protein